jgi:hypothetical protein
MLLSITDHLLEQNKIVNVWHRQSILFAVGKLKEASEHLTSGRSDSLGEVTATAVQLLAFFVVVQDVLSDAFCCNRKQTKARRATFSFRIGEREVQTSLSCSKCALNPWGLRFSWTWIISAKYVFFFFVLEEGWVGDWCWQGAFDQQLWKTMGGAKNVLLVWTKGCMDRFLDESDPTNQGDRHLWRGHDFQLTCIPQILFERNTLSLSN